LIVEAMNGDEPGTVGAKRLEEDLKFDPEAFTWSVVDVTGRYCPGPGAFTLRPEGAFKSREDDCPNPVWFGAEFAVNSTRTLYRPGPASSPVVGLGLWREGF